jgi:hypothetical protein
MDDNRILAKLDDMPASPAVIVKDQAPVLIAENSAAKLYRASE